MAINDKTTDQIARLQKRFPLSETVSIVANNLIKQLSGEVMYIPVWSGNPGIGKTTYAKMIADKLNLNIYYVSMCKNLEFFMGLPITSTLKFDSLEDAKNSYVVWSEPELIHMANLYAKEPGKRGCLILFDDIHIMSRETQACFFELVLERKLGNYKLAQNVCMIGCMNDSSASGFDGYLAAINNRLQMISVYNPFETWYDNCGADLNPLVASYCKYDSSNLEEPESTTEPFATYRSWTTLSKLIDEPYKIYCKNGDKKWFLSQVRMLAAGFMSWKKMIEFMNNINTQLQYNFENMVESNSYYVDKEEPIAQFCFGNIIRYLRNKKDVDNLVAYLKKEVTQNSVDDYKNVILNILYEALTYRNMLLKKNGDAQAKEKIDLIGYLQEAMFMAKELCANTSIRDLLKRPQREIFAEIKR